ncbi:MAG: hypothetical protein JKX76_01340 [Colwellia sp.]|nr:hypothetical protein [Colwellia sp.]
MNTFVYGVKIDTEEISERAVDMMKREINYCEDDEDIGCILQLWLEISQICQYEVIQQRLLAICEGNQEDCDRRMSSTGLIKPSIGGFCEITFCRISNDCNNWSDTQTWISYSIPHSIDIFEYIKNVDHSLMSFILSRLSLPPSNPILMILKDAIM